MPCFSIWRGEASAGTCLALVFGEVLLVREHALL